MINDTDTWVIGVDLGATKIAAGLVDPNNVIVSKVYAETRVAEGPAAVVGRIVGCVERLRSDLPSGQTVAALGICCPGPIDHVNGVVLDPPNMTGWLNEPLQQMLEEALSLPAPLEHDAKAAALGEFYFGAGRERADMIYIVVGTGVGAAIIIDGHLYRGANNAAGEIGHMTVDMGGPACSCGSNGCLEGYVAGPDLVDRYREIAERAGIEAAPDLDGPALARMAAAGHAQARAVFEQAGQALGVGIAAMAHMFDIDLYIIGGSVVQAGELLLAPTRQGARYRAFDSIGSRLTVVASPLGDDAAILGCAWTARQSLHPYP